MFKTIRKYVLEPALPRLGSFVAGVLIPYGLNADLAQATGAFVVAGAALAYDLVAHFITVRNAKADAVSKLVNGNA